MSKKSCDADDPVFHVAHGYSKIIDNEIQKFENIIPTNKADL